MMFTQSDEAIVWLRIREFRAALHAYLSSLDEAQWNGLSLCDGWRIRDVVAHLLIEYRYSAKSYWKDFIQSGFNINRFMRDTAIRYGNKPITELLHEFKDMINAQNRPASVSVFNILVDLLVHEQDIRRALGHNKAMDKAMLRLIFEHWEPDEYNLGERITGLAKRINGLQFVITDLGITKGNGPKVDGRAEDILLTVLGREVSIDNLSGDGVKILRHRL